VKREVVLLLVLILVIFVIGCTTYFNEQKIELIEEINMKKENSDMINLDKYSKAYFAGGCFWCMEAGLEAYPGVIEVISGYMGGVKDNPSYEDVLTGKTGHFEAVEVYYDPKVIPYQDLVEAFWRQIDPTDTEGQFADKGTQYKTAIFYQNDEEKLVAEKSKTALDNSKKFDKPIVTQILPFKPFHKAEEYHQDYYKKRTVQYKVYEEGSGRAGFKREVWDEKSSK
jgi:methionine-S-sulfoxide reductase